MQGTIAIALLLVVLCVAGCSSEPTKTPIATGTLSSFEWSGRMVHVGFADGRQYQLGIGVEVDTFEVPTALQFGTTYTIWHYESTCMGKYVLREGQP